MCIFGDRSVFINLFYENLKKLRIKCCMNLQFIFTTCRLSHLNVKQKFVVGAQAEAESHPRAESEALLRSQQAAETKNEPPTALK